MPRRLMIVAAFCCAAACARGGAPELTPPVIQAAAPAPEAASTSSASPSLPGAVTQAADASWSAEAAAANQPNGPGVAPAVARLPDEGLDLTAEALQLFRVAACGPSGDLPSRFDATVVSRHCAALSSAYEDYKKSWVNVAGPFIARLRPSELPTQVVYPFGGGDLVSALATFPEATEITTISLEPAGDVRLIEKLAPEHLARELAAHRAHLERLFEKAHSRTDNLEKEAQAELPGEVVFALAALVVHGYEPTGLRYFRLEPDGAIHYVTEADLAAQAHHPRALRSLFDNVELRFRAEADGSPGREGVLRHIAFNLDDEHLRADPALLAHLAAKGKVAAMTKAATHLLWTDHFGLVRGYLLEHADWMVSDSTGIPPRFTQPAGFTQDTYGKFDGPSPFGQPNGRDASDFKRLFESEPARELAFRYGYPDKDGHAHLIVTHR